MDEALIAALQEDGRASYSDLATRLGVPRTLVSQRLRGMLERGDIRIVAAADPAVLGEPTMAHVAIRVAGKLGGLVDRLVERSEVPLVSATSGAYDVVAELRARDHAGLYELLAWVRSFPEVSETTVLLYVDIRKGTFISRYAGGHQVDTLDAALIELMQQDGRMSYRRMAERVNLSQTAVRNRVRRLVEDRVVRVSAVIAHSERSGRLKVGVGLNLRGAGETVIEYLSGSSRVEFLSLALGRFDLIATLNSGDPAELFAHLEELKRMTEVLRMETWFHLRTFKEDYARPVSTSF